MLNLIACEWLKWRRSRMLWMILLGALLPIALVFLIQLNSSEPFDWKALFTNNLFIMTMLMCPALFALLTGYLFAREFQERTVNNLLTGPYSRNKVMTAKFLIALPVLFSVVLLAFLLTFGIGFFFTSKLPTSDVLFGIMGKYGLLFILEYALVPLSAAVALLWRSYIPAMGLGVFAVVSIITIMQSKFIMYYPWSAPLNFILNVSPDLNSVTIGATSIGAAFLIPLVFIAVYFRRSDVHSG
ncbi:ABC transporter permease [Paenibacillus silvisoli]|uniref:ABC transporter permease n=1 Tax=Paenibacillus silvisoli TaxID=3110539 RepID=UPI0028043DF3|nr:ABC transporter permease [Paenibacillus silvisoli]